MFLALLAATGMLVSVEDANALLRQADQFHQRGQWAESAKAYRNFEHDSNPQVRFHALNRIAVAELNLGELTAAERTLKQTLKFLNATTALTPDNMGVALANLGSLQLRRGQLSRAEETLRRSVGLLETTLGPGDLQTIRSRDNLAVSLVLQGKPRTARVLLEQSLSLSKDPRSADMAATHVNHALVLAELGEMEQAEASYRNVMTMLPPTHSDYPKVLFSLGRFLKEHKRWPDAAKAYLEAANILEQAVGTDTYLYALVAFEYLDLPRKVVDREKVKVSKRTAEGVLRAYERNERKPSTVDYQDLVRTYR